MAYPKLYGLTDNEMEEVADMVELDENENIVRQYLADYSNQKLSDNLVKIVAQEYRTAIKDYIYLKISKKTPSSLGGRRIGKVVY